MGAVLVGTVGWLLWSSGGSFDDEHAATPSTESSTKAVIAERVDPPLEVEPSAHEVETSSSMVEAPAPRAAPHVPRSERGDRDLAESLPPDWMPPPKEVGSVIVTARWRSNGEPIERLMVYLEPQDGRELFELDHAGFTDSGGTVRFEHVPTGHVWAWANAYGSQQGGAVVADGTLQLDMSIVDVCRIEGVVLDPERRPVSGAEIWDSKGDRFRTAPGRWPLAISDEQGAFECLGSNSRNEVYFATADEGPPSTPGYLRSCEVGATERLELRIGAPGESLKVSIVGPNGEAVGDAMVRLSFLDPEPPSDWFVSTGPGGAQCRVWFSKTRRSDATGAVEFRGLVSPSIYFLEARASGCAWNAEKLTLRADLAQPHVLRLHRGRTIEGRATLLGGLPAAGATIVASSWLGGQTAGPDELESRFDAISTRADADGCFRLSNVPIDECRVYANCDELYVYATLPAKPPGSMTWWSPLLDRTVR